MSDKTVYDVNLIIVAVRSECCETAFLLVQRHWKALHSEEDEAVREKLGWALSDALQSGSQL